MSNQPTAPPATQPAPPPLNLANIQGDIILGLPKKVEEYVFFQITNAALFRKRIKHILPFITTMAQTVQNLDEISKHKKSDAIGLVKISGTNIAFSQFGLHKMGVNEDLHDGIFAGGQRKDAEELGDSGEGTGDSFDPNWDLGFKQQLDGVLLFTAECRISLAVRVAEVLGILLGTIKVVTTLFGNVRPDEEKGHEHFGFLDGISQPGIEGFTKDLHPGQDAIKPGFIILGNEPDARTSKLAKDGSFLAFRKLNQLVPEFNAFLLKNGSGLDGMSPQEGAEFLGARLIGRWKSGAPIDITPIKDDPALGADSERNNDFDFSFTNPDDQNDQTRCPFAAHVRKTYPRQDLEKHFNIDANRIIRQGIPFGPEVSAQEKREGKTFFERGLAFVSYQANLSNGFAFIQKSWVNTPSFPPEKTNPDGSQLNPGFDPIISQQGNKPRSMVGFDPKSQNNSLGFPQEFVVSKGGEYFFTPSIIALKEVIGTA